MHNGAEQMEMSLCTWRDYVFSETQRKCQLVMNKQRHCGETVWKQHFDLSCDTLLEPLHNGRAQNYNLYEDETGSNAPPEKHITGRCGQNNARFIGLALCGAKSTAFWIG